MVLTGPSGFGKSALLAKLCEEEEKDDRVEIVKVFIGTNPASFNISSVLKYLILSLQTVNRAQVWLSEREMTAGKVETLN